MFLLSDKMSLISAETSLKLNHLLRLNLQRFKLLTVVLAITLIASLNWPLKPVCLRSQAEFSYFCFSARLQPTKLAPFQLMAAYTKLEK